MIKSIFEFYEHRIAANPSSLTVARFGKYAIAALVSDAIHLHDFSRATQPYNDEPLLLEDPLGHIPLTRFSLRDIKFVLGSEMAPQRVFVGDIGPTNRQFTFRIGEQGNPAFEVYPVDACI